jgi:hypothetical protein
MQFLYKVFTIIISLLFATIYTNFIGNLLTHQKDISLQFGKSNIKLEKVEKVSHGNDFLFFFHINIYEYI